MPRQEQIIPQYLHPHVETYINDNSVYTTEKSSADDSVKALHVFTSNRGIDNKVLRFDTFSDWKRMYGTPDYKWDGQAVMMPYATLSSGYASTFNMRVMPEDATHAYVVVTVTPDTGDGTLKLDWNYETSSVKLTSFDRETIKSNITSTYVADKQPVFAFVCKGRGEYGNRIYAEFSENLRASRSNGFLSVDVRTAEIDEFGEDYNGQTITALSPYEDALSGANLTAFMEEILEDDNIDVDVIVFEDTLEMLYEKYTGLADHDDVSYLQFDFLYGRFYGENEEYRPSLKSFSSNFRDITDKYEKLFTNGSEGKLSKYVKVDREKIKTISLTGGSLETTYTDNTTSVKVAYKIDVDGLRDIDPDKVTIKGGRNKYIYTVPTNDGLIAKVYMIPTPEEVSEAGDSLVSELKVKLKSIYANETVQDLDATVKVTFTSSGTYPVVDDSLTTEELTYGGVGFPCEEALELSIESEGSAIPGLYNIYYTSDKRVMIDPLTGVVTPLEEVTKEKPLQIQVKVKQVVDDPLGTEEPLQYGKEKEFTVTIKVSEIQAFSEDGTVVEPTFARNTNLTMEKVLNHNYSVVNLLSTVRPVEDILEESMHVFAIKKDLGSSIKIPNKDRQDVIDELFIEAFNGNLDKKIKSTRNTPVDYILDANYSDMVKMALNTLVQKRQDCLGYIDAGITIQTPKELIEYYESGMTAGVRGRNIIREGQYYTIRDPFTKKRITVTSTYFVAQQMPSHIFNSGRHIPFVGETEATVTGVLRNTFLPVIDCEDVDTKEALYNLGVNVYEVLDTNKYVRTTQSTSQTISSDLSEENNMLTLLKIKREIEAMVSSLTYNFSEAEDRKKFTESADRLISKYRGIAIRTGTVNFSVTPYEEERNIIHCYLNIVFKSMAKIGIIEIDINSRVTQ